MKMLSSSLNRIDFGVMQLTGPGLSHIGLSKATLESLTTPGAPGEIAQGYGVRPAGGGEDEAPALF